MADETQAPATQAQAADTAAQSEAAAPAEEVGPLTTYHARYWLEPKNGHGRCFDDQIEAISPGHAETAILAKHKGMVVKDLVISVI